MAEEPTTSADLEESSNTQHQAATSTSAAAAAQDDQPAQQIELNDDPEHSEHGYESASVASSNVSTSLASGVRDYDFENRRRYHKYKEGQYHFPNDDVEQEREDMKHAMVVHLCSGKLHSAPLENPQKILDVGTGTGIWAIDMGDEYPEADVIGTDLSPIQPDFVPPNVQFFVDDAEVEWVYPDNSFDYVHLRNMAPSIKKWPELFAEAYR
ncbi:secondary metabolism regulator LAE1 [Colletotrichum spaethianum]|uniref:Secondary metabolism regulator LAE1 n=1 Tax=Colletotrichum spaethianum TaxID=700344 RepID=A0AA37UKF6_9PEZI|nr:secondary metabolism regulator LAE1 [Colletotrichum spaethianum]GKT51224.1 secondary metabolism regulator LAE1 [Colletotrichum spaethianum]